jgi:hypothetical protein
MDLSDAKKIGGQQGIISVGLGILIAQLIMVVLLAPSEGLLNALIWIIDFDYLPNILVGIMTMLLSGYLFGELAGKEIILKKRDSSWVGFKYGFLTLWTGSSAGSLIGCFVEGFHKIGTNSDPFIDYIVKPLFWVTFFGIIPVLIVGFWFGKQIKKKSQ